MKFQKVNNALKADFLFNDFVEAMAFINEVAIWSEKHNHHPELFNVYNKVNISLSTHDAGNIVTEKDEKLAAKIIAIYQKYKI